MSDKKNISKELTEILSDAIAGRPDLQERLSTALGASPKKLVTLERTSFKDKKKFMRQMLNRQYARHEINSRSKKVA